MNSQKLKKHLILLLPYIILGLVCTNLSPASACSRPPSGIRSRACTP